MPLAPQRWATVRMAFALFSSNNSIGGGLISSRNVISGNYRGVSLETTASSIWSPRISLAQTSTVPPVCPTLTMVSKYSGPTTPSAAPAPSRRNVISGNGTNGILVYGSAASGNLIEGNYIGTKVSGTAALPNGIGIRVIDAPNTKIGGIGGAGNLISECRLGRQH